MPHDPLDVIAESYRGIHESTQVIAQATTRMVETQQILAQTQLRMEATHRFGLWLQALALRAGAGGLPGAARPRERGRLDLVRPSGAAGGDVARRDDLHLEAAISSLSLCDRLGAGGVPRGRGWPGGDFCVERRR